MFTWNDGRSCAAPCRACGAAGSAQHAVSVTDPQRKPLLLDFYRCAACASLFPHPFEMPAYFIDEVEDTYTKFYVEISAGIDVIARLLSAFRGEGIRRFLDVGCGYGFSLDFATRQLGWEAVGLEPSGYGRVGRRDLGVRIDEDLLGQGSRHDGRRFDLVFSAEVLEHVEEPRAFLGVLAEAVADDGFLLLTTPAAEYVQPQSWHGQVLASLTPGYHSVLFTRDELVRALRRAGFVNVRVDLKGERLFAVASRLRRVDDLVFDDSARDLYLTYLAGRTRIEDAAHVREGMLFRLFKEQVNLGRLDAAALTYADLTASLERTYGTGLLDRLRSPRFPELTRDLETYGVLAPYFAAPLLFYAGMLELNGRRAPEAAARSFAASARLSRSDCARPDAYFVESATLYWTAHYHRGVAELVAERRVDAIATFADIIARDKRGDEGERERFDRYLAARAMKETGVAHLQSGNARAALVWLEAAATRAVEPENIALVPEIHRLMDLARSAADGSAQSSQAA